MRINPAYCRCGHLLASETPHPCHHNGYTCGQPAKQRFYSDGPAGLAGSQFKLSVTDTWACEPHWESFLAARETLWLGKTYDEALEILFREIVKK